jgi:parallel beta-helix repeat protein
VSDNLVSGNDLHGIEISSGTHNQVTGNLVGTNAGGSAALGNTQLGIFIRFAASNTIGGTGPGTRNVIAGNGAHGIRIAGNTSTGNVVEGNSRASPLCVLRQTTARGTRRAQ